MRTTIKSCSCSHNGQDKLHGKGRRVHNQLQTPKDKKPEWRCTVCGAVRE